MPFCVEGAILVVDVKIRKPRKASGLRFGPFVPSGVSGLFSLYYKSGNWLILKSAQAIFLIGRQAWGRVAGSGHDHHD